jgi:hypothetical protein
MMLALVVGDPALEIAAIAKKCSSA